MWFFAGNKTSQVLLEHGSRNDEMFSGQNAASFFQALATNYSTTVENISLYTIADSSSDAVRIMNGDTFSLVWSNGEITGVSFAAEDSMNILRFEVRDENGDYNDTLTANGIDLLNVTAYVFLADMVTLKTDFNETVLVPIFTPSKRQAYIKVVFVNGVAQKVFKTTEYGIWKIPNGYKFDGMSLKISSEIAYDINALLDM